MSSSQDVFSPKSSECMYVVQKTLQERLKLRNHQRGRENWPNQYRSQLYKLHYQKWEGDRIYIRALIIGENKENVSASRTRKFNNIGN